MTTNIPEYTVTELSNALKNVVETSFDKIIVKGEVSRIFIAQSGHAYITIKDEFSVLETICFKNVFEKIKLIPEQGLEVQCKGRMSTFSKKSSYQLIITDIRPAGLGALMAMLEARKQKLLKEGYFDEKRKKKIPFLPEVIGVITSLKGAVIRDILHRFRERFPREVLIWPTLVQGDDAPEEIINAIKGFNAISEDGKIIKPDVIIVARGGGSIEDLWCFNDEELVVAVSNSDIPIISAIGHETDTTLIDLAADYRAPTPSAAAEIVVPVRIELIDKVSSFSSRLVSSLIRVIRESDIELNSLKRGVINPEKNIEGLMQRIDFASSKLKMNMKQKLISYEDKVLSNRVNNKDILYNISDKVKALSFARKTFVKSLNTNISLLEKSTDIIYAKLKKKILFSKLDTSYEKFNYSKKIFETLSYKNTIKRGFVLVRSIRDRKPIQSFRSAIKEKIVEVEFYDGSVDVKVLKENKKTQEKNKNSILNQKIIQEKLL
ncbi:MAG: Exodeoxyribonuclease 7 large subunit [Alphaproteobacteria bacterium MarineAlpha2_Bin1]|nr:MAG: Exodeoxyribonuclease 7 large subunit [Alphaproteobacteria bacterium MarineAlpha2_Bin1]